MPLPPHLGPRYRPGMEAAVPEPSRWERARAVLCPPHPRLLAGAFAALVAALGLWGLWFQARLPHRLPSALDWRAAAALLEREARPGDAVALSPMWAERARQVLPPTLPVMAFPRYDPREEDLVGVRRVWLLSLPDAPRRSRLAEADLARRSALRDSPQRIGGLEVTRFDLRAPTIPLAFLPDRLAGARVSLGDRPCPADAGGVFRCPGPPWLRVAREVREVAFLPRPCLLAHPGPDPRAPVAIELRDVPIGRTLRGHTGIVGEAMLRGEAPVRLEVRLDGELLGAAEEPPRTPGWHAFQIDTARRAGTSGTFLFLVSSPDARERHFCFDAMTLP